MLEELPFGLRYTGSPPHKTTTVFTLQIEEIIIMRSANCFPALLPSRSRQSPWKPEDDGGGNTTIKQEDEEDKPFDLALHEYYSQTDLLVTDNDLRLAQTDNSFLATRINNAIGYALTDLSRRRAIEGLPVDQEAMSLFQTAFASKISQVTRWREQLSLGPYSAMKKIGARATDDTVEIYPGEVKVHVIALPMSKAEIQVQGLLIIGYHSLIIRTCRERLSISRSRRGIMPVRYGSRGD